MLSPVQEQAVIITGIRAGTASDCYAVCRRPDHAHGGPMTNARRCAPRLVTALSLSVALRFIPAALEAQSPPAQPPADWGPISINMEEISYPHPVEFLNLQLFGQDVRIAYMDVSPVGPPNGRTVVLPPRRELLRVVLEGADRGSPQRRVSGRREGPPRVGQVLQAHPSVQHEPARIQHGATPRAPGDLPGSHRRPLGRRPDGHPLRLPISGDDDAPRNRQPDPA